MELQDKDLHVGMEDGFEGFVGVVGDGLNPSGFEVIDDEEVVGGGDGGGDTEIWLNRVAAEDHEQDELLDLSNPSLFYCDFPPLPDLPCMSSSSSSYSTPAQAKPVAGSSSSSTASSSASSAASWAFLPSDVEVEDVDRSVPHHQHQHHQEQVFHYPLQGHDHDDQQQQELGGSGRSPMAVSSIDQQGVDDAVDCMDMMETFGCINLLENNEIWDPSPLFEDDGDDDRPHHHHHQSPLDDHDFQQHQEFLHQALLLPPLELDHQQQKMLQDNKTADHQEDCTTIDDAAGSYLAEEKPSSEDLAVVFFEWLKSNKESISAEDLRNIKIKKSTIESTARRLGGGKEGMKQLLKLILQWVQNHHLQRKRMREAAAVENTNTNAFPSQTEHNPYPESTILNPNSNICNTSIISGPPEPNPCLWLQQRPYITDPATIVPPPLPPAFPSMLAYMGTPKAYANSTTSHYPPAPTMEYHMLQSVASWAPVAPIPPPHFSFPPPPTQSHPHAFGNQYPYPFVARPGDCLVRLGSSATKEARKKRMARQRRLFTHDHRSQNHQNNLQNQMVEQRMVDDNCSGGGVQGSYSGWVYWPSAAGGPVSVAGQMQTADHPVTQGQSHQRQNGADNKKQGWKTEKNLRFLLQKVLKQSDVGNLGRIVLPKKEAESHLPELEARDGIPIAMEDIGTSRVWNMRYRYFNGREL
ncbi:B3 domain-containing transcription factor, partial [Ancistrocladus abbreviatus]